MNRRWAFALILALSVLVSQAVTAQMPGADVGYVTVTSIPLGASVVIDGTEYGTTPVAGIELPAGRHSLTATLIGYQAAGETFNLNSGEQKGIDLSLVPYAPTTAPTTRPPTTITTAPTTIPFTTFTIPPTRPVTTITIAPGTGWIITHCNVDGASVTFDSGKPGCTVQQGVCTVEVGTTWSPYLTFTIRKPGYQTYTGQVDRWPGPGESVDLYATLTPLPPSTGSISASTSPSGAAIYLNGEYRGYSPLTIDQLSPQTYTVAAKLDGYTSVSQYVTVYASQTSAFYAQLKSSPPPPRDTGDVYFTSVPGGAQVSVDNSYRGVTPITVSLFPGNHNVLIRMSGYSDWSNTVYVTANTRQTMNAQLSSSQVYGWVTISSNPTGANVYFDNAYKGQTDSSGSFTINGVMPGAHSLRLSLQGYNDYQTTVPVVANTEAYVPAILTPSGPSPTQVPGGGEISVISSPTGSEIYLDNVFMGYTPTTLQSVLPGTRTVMLKALGYQDSVNTVSVSAGSSVPLTVTLLPATPPATRSGTGSLVTVIGVFGALSIMFFKKKVILR
ncbi:MAG: PEGA domain-containing protein [Methanoregulaceae archaeon]|nr:PEGA domain-containing protein [Methanoregulaceae archaeon]